MITIIYFRYKEKMSSVIKLEERPDKQQIIIVFLQGRGEHVTLHPQKDGTILRTHYSEDKIPSSWDNLQVEVAKSLGYRDPERHGKYFAHDTLVNFDGKFPICGRRFDLYYKTKEKPKYKIFKKVIINATKDNFMLNLSLVRSGRIPHDAQWIVPTFLGTLMFEIE